MEIGHMFNVDIKENDKGWSKGILKVTSVDMKNGRLLPDGPVLTINGIILSYRAHRGEKYRRFYAWPKDLMRIKNLALYGVTDQKIRQAIEDF